MADNNTKINRVNGVPIEDTELKNNVNIMNNELTTQIDQKASDIDLSIERNRIDNLVTFVESENGEVELLLDSTTDNNVEIQDTFGQKIDDLKNEINVERNRINSISSLTEGSTTGDAELIDIRNGVDGTVYDNAGSAVRSQVNELNSQINNNMNKTDLINLTDNIQYDLRVLKNDNDNVRIAFKYNTDFDLFLDFGKCGLNELPQIKKISIAHNTNEVVHDDLSRSSTAIMTSVTDWVGPYIVRAVNNIDGSNPNSKRFTGGWHGTNGDQTGSKTATNVEFTIKINGIDIETGKTYKTNELEIIVKNEIQAYNTTKADGSGRNVMQERLHYSITKENIQVTNSIFSREDIVIEKYYFIQTQNAYVSNIIYRHSNDIKLVDLISSTNSGTKTDSPNVDSISLLGNGHFINTWVDRTYGLGVPDYVSDDKPLAFVANYGSTAATGKSYYNIINGIELSMPKYSIQSIVGGYNFTSYNVKQNMNSAFYIKKYGNDMIFVNAFGSAFDYILPRKNTGKIVEKDKGNGDVFVDKVMTTTGLYVKNNTTSAQCIDILIK